MNQNPIRVSVALFLLAPLLQLFCYGQLPIDIDNAIGKLRSANEQIRMEGYSELLDYRLRYIAALMQIAEDKTNPEQGRAKAMKLLGSLRATEAIPLLIEEINFTVPVQRPRGTPAPPIIKGAGISVLFRNPAVEALQMLGKPVIPIMIKLIRKSEDDEVKFKARVVIRGIVVSLPEGAANKFFEEVLHERPVLRSFEDWERALNQVVEEKLKSPPQKNVIPMEKMKITVAQSFIPFVEKLKNPDENVQEQGSKEIYYSISLLTTELCHRIINDREGLPPSKRLARELLGKFGALRED